MTDKTGSTGVVRAMISDVNERGRVITVEEMPDEDIVSVVVADGSERGGTAVIVFDLDSQSARELGQALVEAADGLEAESDD
jgi:hypothetical protein